MPDTLLGSGDTAVNNRDADLALGEHIFWKGRAAVSRHVRGGAKINAGALSGVREQ